MAYTTRFGKLIKIGGRTNTPSTDRFVAEKKAAEKKAEDKGVYGKNCNREACQCPPASWYNTGTRKWYCGLCARLINNECRRMGMELICIYDPVEFRPAVEQPVEVKNIRTQFSG